MIDYSTSFDDFIFEIKYSFGSLYYDRCGQTVNDIEKSCEGWYFAPHDKVTGVLEKPEQNLICQFTNDSFVFHSEKPAKIDIESTISEAKSLWKIVQANLGLSEYTRIGARFNYLKATEGEEVSEQLLQSSSLNLVLPDRIREEFNINTREIVAIFDKNGFNYRFKLNGIRRAQAINPSKLIKASPRSLSTRQKEFFLKKMQQTADYSANPMFAVLLDIDCFQYHPEKININNFVLEQYKLVKEFFLPILEEL